jgi:membrane protease subunit HflC
MNMNYGGNNEPIDLNKRNSARKALKAVKGTAIFLAALIVAMILFNACTYTIGENEQAVISQFGVIKEVVLTPTNDFVEKNPDLMNAPGAKLDGVKVIKDKGLRFKMPFLTQVSIYDGRLNTFTSNAEPVNTKDKKQYYVTIYGQWQISNPALFSITQQNMTKARQYLDNLVFPVIIQNINNLSAEDFVSNKDVLNETMAEALAQINDTVRESGISFADIQINRTLLPDANMQSTYERMIANRAKVAQQLRSEGEETYQKSVSEADKEARVIKSDAIRDAERIKGEGDAEAIRIYAEAYGKDEAFYTYWRSLQAMEAMMADNTTLVLDQNHPLWKDILSWASEVDVKNTPASTPAPQAGPSD